VSADPRRVVSFLAAEKPSIELQTADLCFLAALHLRAAALAATSFEEDQLVDVFEQVSAILESTGEPAAKRATHAIRRLREQRLLARVDGRGVVRAGEFALTRLATGIVEFFLEEESLTRESLTLLSRALLTSLGDVAHASARAITGDDWKAGVASPLRVIIGDLARGIERRQRGFDLHQAEVQREIGALLQAEWFGAVEKSQTLLETTSAVLRDLQDVLLRDMHQAIALLTEVQDHMSRAAPGTCPPEVEVAVRDATDQVDRIASWGSARLRAWSEFYQYVHRYVRDVIRLDPSRLLMQRLREQLAGKLGRPFALTIAAAPPLRLLRTETPPVVDKPPVKRPRKPREHEPEDVEAEDPRARLAANVRDLLAGGAASLSEITRALTGVLPRDERFASAGRIAESVSEACDPAAAAERAWTDAGDGLVIEEWRIRGAS
jgi:chromosome partition protein MukF